MDRTKAVDDPIPRYKLKVFSTCSINFGSIAAIDSILVCKGMFSWARNLMVTICIAYFAPMSHHIVFQNDRCLKFTCSIIFGSNARSDATNAATSDCQPPNGCMGRVKSDLAIVAC